MKKFSELTKLEILQAKILTKLQEWSIRLYCMTKNKTLKNVLGKLFDIFSLSHYKLFSGFDLYDIKIHKMDHLTEQEKIALIKKHIMPFAKRQMAICLKIINENSTQKQKINRKIIEIGATILSLKILAKDKDDKIINLVKSN